MDKAGRLTRRLEIIERAYPFFWTLCIIIPIPLAIMIAR